MATLGISKKSLYGESPTVSPESTQDDELVFPSVSLNAKQVEAAGLSDVEFGETFTATIKGRVSRIGGYDDGATKPDITFRLMSVDGVEITDADESKESDEPDDSEKKLPAGVPKAASGKKTISPKDTSIK